MDYIPIIISVFGITISMLSYMMGQKNGTKKEAEKQGKLNSDIEYIKKDVAEIKKDVKTINVDQINTRIDGIEKRVEFLEKE